jgi:hypothetical protein
MRFLVDAQLPPALARWLSGKGHEAEHVADRQMEAASDTAISRFGPPRQSSRKRTSRSARCSLKRDPSRQREAWLHYQTGQRLYQATLGAGRDVFAERGRQTQRSVARLDRRAPRAQAREARHGRARQQACPDHMGDHDNGRGLSYRDVREGIEPFAGADFFKKSSARSSLASAK